MKPKDIRMLLGVIVHPFKALYWTILQRGKDYDVLKNRAQFRQEMKASERALYMATITRTKLNFK